VKTAIYIEDGTVQLVITPETEFEKNALRSFEDRPLQAQVFAGSFYDCRGGWVRQADYREPWGMGLSNRDSNDRSLILRMAEPEPPRIDDPTASTPPSPGGGNG